MVKIDLNKLIKKIEPYLKKQKVFLILIALFISGSFLRINGLNWGLPLLLHPDEAHIINQAVRIASTGDLDPTVYNRPDHIGIYLNAFVYKVFSYAKYHNSDMRGDVQYLYNNNPSPYVYLARLTIAIFGILMILSMYLLGKEIGGTTVGLLSSCFTAFFPGFIQHSHYVTPDIPLAFFISMAALFTCKYMKKRRPIFLFLGCIFCGLATVEKYPGLIATFMIVCAVVITYWHKKIKILLLGTTSLLVYFSSMFMAAPFLFINYKETINTIIFEAQLHHFGVSNLGWGRKLLFYLDLIHQNMGTFLWIFFLFGILLFFIKFKRYIRIKKHYLAISLFGLTYLVLISTAGLHWERWAIPMYIVPLIIASVGINNLSVYLKARSKILGNISVIIIGIIVLSIFFRGIYQSFDFLKQNTQTVSKKWITENLPEDARIVAEGYTPIIPGLPFWIVEKSIEVCKREGVDYVIVSSAMYERFFAEEDRYPDRVKFYRELFNKEKLVKRFSASAPDFELGRNDLLAIYRGIHVFINNLRYKKSYLVGPEIRIYKLL